MDLNEMMQQAQRMQMDLARAQEEVQSMTFSATAGGGAVEAVVTGGGEIQSLHIAPEAVDPDDVEMLEDLIVAAVNEALRAAAQAGEQRMGSATGIDLNALGLGGLF